MTRRINLFSGPGAAKSTTAAGIFHELKKNGINCEHIKEYVKGWAWIDRKPEFFDQVLISAKQLHSEDLVLRHSSKPLIVTDCPVLLNAAYAARDNLSFTQELIGIAAHFEETYPSLNIFLDRGDRSFRSEGRWGTREDAVQMDIFIKDFIKDKIPFQEFRYDDFDEIISYIRSGIV